MRLISPITISTRRKCSYILPVFIALWIYTFVQITLLREGIVFWPWTLFTPTIPVLAITLTVDPENYLIRLLESIDHKVDSIVIIINNENENIVKSITNHIKIFQSERSNLPIKVIELKTNSGYAHGINIGLNEILSSNLATWGIVVQSEIAFYPGMLRRFSTAFTYHMHRDRKIGIGFPSICCGGEWSAFAITKSLINRVGLIDENIYPRLYEDNDYSVRIHLSGYHSKKFQYIPLIFGKYNGRVKYESHATDPLHILGEDTSQEAINWIAQINRGKISSENYLVEKWGFQGNPSYFRCRMMYERMSSSCNATYNHPFNNSVLNISHWSLQPARREWILHGVDPKPFKVFDMNRKGDE